MQKQAFEDVPYVPLGQNFYPTGFRSDITGIMDGFVIFWNVKRA
jgi:peptide/nickel transport system substrate-binding protein